MDADKLDILKEKINTIILDLNIILNNINLIDGEDERAITFFMSTIHKRQYNRKDGKEKADEWIELCQQLHGQGKFAEAIVDFARSIKVRFLENEESFKFYQEQCRTNDILRRLLSNLESSQQSRPQPPQSRPQSPQPPTAGNGLLKRTMKIIVLVLVLYFVGRFLFVRNASNDIVTNSPIEEMVELTTDKSNNKKQPRHSTRSKEVYISKEQNVEAENKEDGQHVLKESEQSELNGIIRRLREKFSPNPNSGKSQFETSVEYGIDVIVSDVTKLLNRAEILDSHNKEVISFRKQYNSIMKKYE